MKAPLLALALLLAPVLAAAQEPGIVPFEVALAGLAAEDSTTRSAAARELAFQGRPEAVAAILAALTKPEPDPWVRKDFYAALGQLGGPGVLEALLACLAEESREELVGECAAALGNLGDPAALPALLALADPATASGLVRLRAIDALGFFADPAAQQALAAQLGDPAQGVRRHAIAALAANGGDAAAAALLDYLNQAATGEEEATIAVQALGLLADRVDLTAAMPQLALLLADGSSRRLFGTTARTLGSIGGDAAVAVLSAALRTTALDRQAELVRALERSGSALAAPSLLAELSLGGAALARADHGALLDPEARWDLRLALLEALCRALAATDPTGSAGLAAPLLVPSTLPRDSAPARFLHAALLDLRLAAIDLLAGDRGNDRALELLMALAAAEPVARVRAAAARALGRLGRPEAGELLARLLQEADRELRWSAAIALGDLGQPAALPALQAAAAGDADALVRRAAAEAAARIAQPD